MQRPLSLLDLTTIKGASRAVRAYAFLDASLSVADGSSNPVRDALDCFLPFVAAGVTNQAGDQLDLTVLQKYLRETFGFDVPIYALQQFTGPLRRDGHLNYDAATGVHICIGRTQDFLKEQTRTLASFDDLEDRISRFAKSSGLQGPLLSASWLDALISFLKEADDVELSKVVTVKGVMTKQGAQIEHSIIGRFVEDAHKNDRDAFSSVLSVFKGILIADFISAGVQASLEENVKDLVVYYDTRLLMRLLGTSGKLLGDATGELHRHLTDIGCSTQFLHVTESEVDNIIKAIIEAKDSGNSIYGETGEALDSGECTVTKLRMLNGSFVETLAQKNVFESKDRLVGIAGIAKFQIDETGFDSYLKSEAEKRDKHYSPENRRNDAQALGTVMVFRRGHTSRDALKSKRLFITDNRLLAAASRRYLVDQGQLKWVDCPPMLDVGQFTTIMWILRAKRLEDTAVTSRLLANCFAAYRPEPEWFDKFVEAISNAKALESTASATPLNDAILLQAARRMAQEQSFGRTAILQKLKMAEILSLARAESANIRSKAHDAGHELGVAAAYSEIELAQRARADRLARIIVLWGERASIAIAILAALLAIDPLKNLLPGWGSVLLIVFGAPIAVLSALDLFGVKVVGPAFAKLRSKISDKLFRLLRGS